LHATNCIAYEMLHGNVPTVNYGVNNTPYDPATLSAEKAAFAQRMNAIPEGQREIALGIYANPVVSKLSSSS
jgi:hypothetical protein